MIFRASSNLMAFGRCWRGQYKNTMFHVKVASHVVSPEEDFTVSTANNPYITTKTPYGDALDALFQTPSI